MQLAQENGVLDKSFKDIKDIDGIFQENRDLTLLFKSPIITADKKQAVVKKLFEGKISDLVYQFITLLIKKGREEFLHEITTEFIKQYNALKGITPVKLISAVKLDS